MPQLKKEIPHAATKIEDPTCSNYDQINKLIKKKKRVTLYLESVDLGSILILLFTTC